MNENNDPKTPISQVPEETAPTQTPPEAADEPPQPLPEAPDWLIENMAEVSRNARRIYFLYVGFLTYCLLTVAGVTDRQLVLNESVHLPIVNVNVSLTGFCFLSPLIGILTFVYLQFYLQRNLEMAQGYSLTDDRRLYPWLLNFARYSRLPIMRWVQQGVVAFVLWCFLPIVSAYIAIVYLKRQEPVLSYFMVGVHALSVLLVLLFGVSYRRLRSSIERKPKKRSILRICLLTPWREGNLLPFWRTQVSSLNLRRAIVLFWRFIVFSLRLFLVATVCTLLLAFEVALFFAPKLNPKEPEWFDVDLSVDLSYQVLVTIPKSNEETYYEDVYWLDLTGAQLQDANFSSAVLVRANLQGADLTGADLTEVYLRESDLTQADLTGADLTEVYLRESDLSGADLTGANLSEAYLGGTHLTEADLTEADLSGAKLDSADLTQANLKSARLNEVEDATPEQIQAAKNWETAVYDKDMYIKLGLDKQGAHIHDLSGKKLRGVNLSSAFLPGANLQHADLTDANFRNADLTQANLTNADLTDVNFRYTNLTHADFTQANLTDAKFFGADLTDANFSDADLTNADLTRAKNITPNQIKAAKNWEHARYDEAMRKALGLPPPEQ